MPRSDGTFPRYTKLEIDPELWPANYWESSRRCQGCEISWPNTHLFNTCPDCGGPTAVDSTTAPDIRWPDAVSRLLASRFERFYETYNEGINDEQLTWDEQSISDEVKGIDSELSDIQNVEVNNAGK